MNSSADQLQRTNEWFGKRWGRITGSRVKDVVAKTAKGLPSASRESYMWELVAERMTDFDPESDTGYVSGAMLHGIREEDNAIAFYEVLTQQEVDRAGFVIHPDMRFAGCSPDGLVGAVGLCEVKCLDTKKHLKAIFSNKPPEEFLDQCHWGMAVTNSKWCDLILYDPRCRDEQQMKIFRIERDEDRIKQMVKEVEAFNAEINEAIKTIKENSL